MQILKEARPLADCFTVPYREQGMAYNPKIGSPLCKPDRALLFPVCLLWKDDIIFFLERIRAFF